jgi:uncharacterized protein YjbI with pentapeptide repeats
MDRVEALKLLKGRPDGVAEWNRRRDAGEQSPSLREANLIRATLIGVNLSRASLNGADLSVAILSDADLRGANLSDADLSGANLRDADLRGADLSRADLSGANLSDADLSYAKLSDADLHGADLRDARVHSANLRGANLSRADLSGADLSGADLSDADLSGADLRDADLRGAYLSEADLSGANLSGARCGGTVFADVDLSTVKGLDSVRHSGPSSLGIETFFRSEGRIPKAFLRSCGVPDRLIQNTPAPIASKSPIPFYSCFISYSSKDEKFVDRLYKDLQGKGIRCWYAPEDLKIGEKIRIGIDESIRLHDKLLLVLSKNSVQSQWVEKEVETAMEKERKQERTVLFPIRLDDAVMNIESGWPADIRRSRTIGAFQKWKDHDSYQKAFDRLLKDLKRVDEPASATAPAKRISRRKTTH